MKVLLLLVALMWPIASLAQPNDLGRRELCYDRGKGPFICITIGKLRRQLPPSKVEELNRWLEDMSRLEFGSGAVAMRYEPRR